MRGEDGSSRTSVRVPPRRGDEDFLDSATLDSEPVDREVIDQLVTQDTAHNLAERPQSFGFHALDSHERVSSACGHPISRPVVPGNGVGR
jgi:hypothetical protein